jgi:redox-sensitive bicupin YhaK (pirin superfamily)
VNIIHFTHGATDPLKGFDAEGAHYVPLADGEGDAHLGCVHLEEGATINAPSLSHAAALLVVHGRITIVSEHGSTRNINIHAGMGAVFEPQEPYTFKSGPGAILLIVEAEEPLPHERGISTPERVAGQTWPSDGATG